VETSVHVEEPAHGSQAARDTLLNLSASVCK
jgi:hypothetical protein